MGGAPPRTLGAARTEASGKVLAAQVQVVLAGDQDDLGQTLRERGRVGACTGAPGPTAAPAGPTLFCLCSRSFRKDGGLDNTFPRAHSTIAFIVDRLGQIPGVM